MAKRHHHYVYVVLLSKDVLYEPKFKKCNPDYDPLKPCVYVGMTGQRVPNMLKRAMRCHDFGSGLEESPAA